jgi:hypothetical protein
VAITLNLASGLFREIIATVVNKRYIRTLTSEHVAHCRTDTSRSTRDERSLSFQQKTHLVMFSPKTPASRTGILEP